jgi:hypothetical protein
MGSIIDLHEMIIHFYAFFALYGCSELIGLFMSVCPGQIWVKFGMEIMPLGTTVKLYFLFSTIGTIIVANEQTCEVGTTLAPFAAEPSNLRMIIDFQQIQNVCIVILL